MKHSAKFLKYIQAQNNQIGVSGKQQKFRILYLTFIQEIYHRKISKLHHMKLRKSFMAVQNRRRHDKN